MNDRLKQEAQETENDVKAMKYKTALTKVRFINDIKKGLGDEIKANKGIRVREIPFRIKLARMIKRFFKMF